MKKSIYNIEVMDDAELLIFNSLKGTYVKTKNNISLIQNILNKPEKYINSKVTERLLELGFLTECENERELAVFKFYESVYDKSLNLCIMPTEQCNFRCIYCYEKFEIGSLSEENIDGLLSWFRKNICNYKSVHISWFGGEPLLALRQIYELSEQMIEVCKMHHKPYTASITTNGYLLSEDVFKRLLKCRVLQFHITIDGDKEKHNMQRLLGDGRPTYDNIIGNLVAISKNVKSKMFNIIIRNNVTKNTLGSIHKFIDEMYQLFGQDARFGFYFRPVGKWENTEFRMGEEELIKNFDEMYEAILDAENHLNYAPYRNALENQMCAAHKRNQYVIRGDGRVGKCTMLLENSENEVGKITPSGIHIEENKIIKWLGLSNRENAKCNNCNLYASCFSNSCPAKGYILKSKNLCGYETKNVKYILKLLNQSSVFVDLDEVYDYGY